MAADDQPTPEVPDEDVTVQMPSDLPVDVALSAFLGADRVGEEAEPEADEAPAEH